MFLNARGLLTSLFLVVYAAITVSAQSTQFNYQGRLTSNSANATGNYDLTFTLWDAASGGGQLGSTVTATGVAVSSGVFSVNLDFGSTAFADGGARFLEISVRPAGSGSYVLLTPRQQISSVPYAVRSLSSAAVDATAGNAVISSINNAATNVTISSSRLGNDVVKLAPSSTQTAATATGSTPLVDVGGTVGTTNSRFRFNHDGGVSFGSDASGGAPASTIPTTGTGYRMMWYPGKWAFRAGKVDSFGSTYWDETNVGYGSVAVGENTRASGDHSFAANLATTASGSESVALGNNGTASGDRSFSFNGTASGVGAVAIGSGSQATSDDALAMGPSSIASGLASVVIGPSVASGSFGVAIGLQNYAAGNFSVAIGKNAKTCSDINNCANTARQGSIVIGDGCAGFSSDAVYATANNQITMRGCGGIRLFTNQGLTSGVELAAGGSAWSVVSDRNMKENFDPIRPKDILRGVLNLPISTWNYKAQGASIRHIGPMAQDFKSIFKIGENDRTISTIDPDGVALGAIQGLYQELKDRDAKIASLQQQLDQQRKDIEALKAASAQHERVRRVRSREH